MQSSTNPADSADADLVVPVLNEAANLPAFFANLMAQETPSGTPLPEGALRVIVVDSESTDGTQAVVEEASTRFPTLRIELLEEPVRHHLVARARGVAHALDEPQRRVLLNADVDTHFHRHWVADAIERLSSRTLEAASYDGSFPHTFWSLLPKLSHKYFEEIGTIFFPSSTTMHYGFDDTQALFAKDLFHEAIRVPSDCCWAVTKDAYVRAGGFQREFNESGQEVMFEGRNLRFRLDRLDAPVGYVDTTPFETSPRRIVYETEKFLTGTSYVDGFTRLRGVPTLEQIGALERFATLYDFDRLRRYVVKHYLLLPLVARPGLIDQTATYLVDPVLREAVCASAERAAQHSSTAAAVHREADNLLARHYEEIVAGVARVRGINRFT